MIEFGSINAVEALGDILLRSHGRELQFACRAVLEGARLQVSRGLPDSRSRFMRQSLYQLADRLQESLLPEHVELCSQLRTLPWEAGADRLWIGKIIHEGFVDKDLKRLRSAGYMEFEMLKSTALAREVPTEQRRRALMALAYCRPELAQRAGLDFLWQLYEEEGVQELRSAALRALRDLGFRPEPWMTQRLYHDHEVGDPKLRQTIIEIWGDIISPQRLELSRSEAGGEYLIEVPFAEALDPQPSGVIASKTNQPRGGPLAVLILHLSEDEQKARELYQRLRDDGFQPWVESENVIPGQNKQLEIRQRIQSSDVIVALLRDAFRREIGLEQQMLSCAIEEVGRRPLKSIFLIPTLVEECEIPWELSETKAVRLFEENGYEKLKLALKARLKESARLLE
jgi:hypothetical protein